MDIEAQSPLPNPQAVSVSGTYYIKAVNQFGCTSVKPVVVAIGQIPVFETVDQKGCLKADITQSVVIGDALPKLNYSYWADEACTIPIETPNAIKTSGTYYIKGATSIGCYSVAAVHVLIYPQPHLIISRPLVILPYSQTANLSNSITPVSGLKYSYWLDTAATKPMSNPFEVKIGKVYYIKAENENGCTEVLPVRVFVDAPPGFEVTAINTFTPNNDGVNDVFNLVYNGTITANYFKIFNRYGELAFNTTDIEESWDGRKDGKDVPVGTYYWIFRGYDEYHKRKFISSGSITVIR